MILSPRATRVLRRYRTWLPPSEYKALWAWLTTFYPFQLEWLLDDSDSAICNKSRQIGLSHTTSALAVIWAVFHGELTTVISVGEREAKEVLDKAEKHLNVLIRLGSKMAELRTDNSSEIVTRSGGRILALPATGGRSFTGNVFLDEYAYHKNADQVWDAAAAVTMLGFKLRVASTPNGVGNDFHRVWELAQDPAEDWSAHEIPIRLAIAQGYPVDLAKCRKLAKGDDRLFGQLFECKFLDGNFQYFVTELINQAKLLPVPERGHTWGGLDIGESRDRTTLLILRGTRKERGVVHVESHGRTDDELLDKLAGEAIKLWGCEKLAVDETGIGTFPAKRMVKTHGENRILPVTFTNKSKEEMATGLYQDLVEDKVALVESYRPSEGSGDDEGELLRKDIAAIRRIVTAAGNVRYDAPRTAKGHADRAWALMLANRAANDNDGAEDLLDAMEALAANGGSIFS